VSPDDGPVDDEPLARPFLTGARVAGAPDDPGVDAPRRAAQRRHLRAHAHRTGDPAGGAGPHHGPRRGARAAHETARILALCGRPQSIAELSAHLGVPVGVTRVLVADLTADDLVAVAARPAVSDLVSDPAFLEGLMLGVAAL
jgi:hypothetical protein